MYNFWVWAQSRRSARIIIRLHGYVVSFWESIFLKLLNNDDEKCSKTSTLNWLVV